MDNVILMFKKNELTNDYEATGLLRTSLDLNKVIIEYRNAVSKEAFLNSIDRLDSNGVYVELKDVSFTKAKMAFLFNALLYENNKIYIDFK